MRYSPDEFGGRRIVHSALSPAKPLEKVVVLNENQALGGRAVTISTKVCRDHDGARKPCQLTLQILPGSPPSGTWYLER